MKLKTLKKKIGRLETRLLEGPKKLAKLKGKLAALVKANAAKAKKHIFAEKPFALKKKDAVEIVGECPRWQLATCQRSLWCLGRIVFELEPT